MGPITHIAGLDVLVEGRYLRQRCAWYGGVLLDHDLARLAVPIPADGSAPEGPAVWAVGALVRVEGENPRVSDVVDAERLPDDACALLDPAVTT